MEQQPKTVTIVVDGQHLKVPSGISVAAAVLGHAHEGPGIRACARHPLNGEGRAPYCLMGVCFECLMEIDGTPNVQSCLVPVAEGMVIRRQTKSTAITGTNDPRPGADAPRVEAEAS